MRLAYIVLPLVLILAACTPSIDGSSDEAFLASFDEVKATVPAEQRTELATGASWIIKAANLDLEQAAPEREALDGMTAQEILANWKIAELRVKLKENRDSYEHYKQLYERTIAEAGPVPDEDDLADIEQVKGLMEGYLKNVNDFEQAVAERE